VGHRLWPGIFVPAGSEPPSGAAPGRVHRARLPALAWPFVLVGLVVTPRDAAAMHLADGVLPASWCVVWALVALPFVFFAWQRFDRQRRRDPRSMPLAAMVGATVFALSCMPIPVPFVGTCSHPCGTGLAAVLLGPLMAVLLTIVALALQALFLAHGGVTTFGADVVSMGVVGGFAGYAAFRAARAAGLGLWGAGFLAGLLSDWATYLTTAGELSLGLHGDRSLGGLFLAVVAAFVPTQLPLGILEGFLTGGALAFVAERRPELLARLHLGIDAEGRVTTAGST
jgi:cobalt/nickel transport system permease protein